MDCYCNHGWQCEEHPDTPCPHDDCSGPGEQCSNPDCPFWRDTPPKALDTSEWDVIVASTRVTVTTITDV